MKAERTLTQVPCDCRECLTAAPLREEYRRAIEAKRQVETIRRSTEIPCPACNQRVSQTLDVYTLPGSGKTHAILVCLCGTLQLHVAVSA